MIVKKRYDAILIKLDDFTKLVDQINLKVMDFNIFDAIKHKDTGEEG